MRMGQSAQELQAEAFRLKAAGRLDEAVGRLEAAVAAAPASSHARHNLAAALGDAGRWSDAEREIRVAFNLGLDAAESWLVLARVLQPSGRLEEAEDAYRQALKRKPGLYDAQRELAQLVWMASGDPDRATADLKAAIRNSPGDLMTRLILAQAQEYCGQGEQSLATLAEALKVAPADGLVAVLAANMASKLGRTNEALAYSEAALRLAPGDASALLCRALALLAAGRADEAVGPVVQVIRQNPSNQTAIAYLATAFRITGHPDYGLLHDYRSLVRPMIVSPPSGWASLTAYLADLGDALRAAHVYREHPFNYSLRHGSQAQDILQHDHPAIRALPGVLDGPIRSYIAGLGRGADPIRSRNVGGYRMQGIWSVQLYPNGYHADHTHQEGWISSAFYVEPVDRPGHEGWIKFGQPGTPTRPALEPDFMVKPEPGMLVLFPSYMWHGTVPFGGDRPRLTCAMDLVPAPG